MFKFILVLSLFVPQIILAQKGKLPPLEWDQNMVKMVAETARDENLQHGFYPDGTKVGKETAKERKVLLLTDKQKSKVVNHSVFWNTVNWCGLSMEKADFSWMQDPKKWNKKQLVYIAVLHGTTTNFVKEQLNGVGKCSKELHDHIKKKYSKIL